MKSLARYVVANAVTRTMLSEILTKDDFESIIRAGSLEEAWTALGKTPYGDWVPDLGKPDELAIEKALRDVTAGRFKRATRALAGEPAEVGELLLSRWELDNLEFALRLWHGKDASLETYITYPSYVNDIPLFEVTAAQSIDEVAIALRHTPYLEPVVAGSGQYKAKGSIFYVETSLEADHYSRLLKAIRALGGRDARNGERLIASEIDLLNLSWLARLVQYYDVKEAEVHEYMIPGPSPISKRLAVSGKTGEALGDITADILGGEMPGIRPAGEAGSGASGRAWPGLERLSLLEHVVGEMGVDTATGLLAGYPFRITSTLAFYILKRTELRNLVTVFAGKAGGADEAGIREKLYGLR
jgi:vacuolar-type H+-ATPase subunit C/Vma6